MLGVLRSVLPVAAPMAAGAAGYAMYQRRQASSVPPGVMSPLAALSEAARKAPSGGYRIPFESADDFRASVHEAMTEHPDAYPGMTPEHVENAHKVYQGARDPSLGAMVYGRWVKDSTERTPGIDQPLRENFREMNESVSGGSVMNSPQWNLLMNDALVLGTAHSGKGAYLSSPRTPENIKDPRYGMTVTGREVAGLQAFGHRPEQEHPALGEVMAVSNPHAARSATFSRYQHVLKGIKDSQGQIRPEVLDELTAPAKTRGVND